MDINDPSGWARPKDLNGYHALRELERWHAASKVRRLHPHWTVSAFRDGHQCCLTWKFMAAGGSVQLAGVTQQASSPEEAVSMSLREFERWLAAWDAQR